MSTISSNVNLVFNGSTSFVIGGDQYNWASNGFLLAVDIYADPAAAVRTATIKFEGSSWGIGTLRFVGNAKAVITDTATGTDRYIQHLFLASPSGHAVTLLNTNVGTIEGGNGIEKLTLSSDEFGTISLYGGNDNVTVNGSRIDYLNLGDGTNTVSISTGYVGAIVGYGGADTVVDTGGEIETVNLGGGNNRLTTGAGYVNSVVAYSGNDTVSIGSGGAESIGAGSGNNIITTSSGEVVSIFVYSGADTVNLGSGGAATVFTGSGNDVVNLTPLANIDYLAIVDGSAGVDTASFAKFTENLRVSLDSRDLTDMSKGYFLLTGFEKLTGGSGADVLVGSGNNQTYLPNNVLNGGAGNDKLTGLAGADSLYGGAGADIFIFNATKDSTVAVGGRDTIFDFTASDDIDLRAIDAKTTVAGNQAFSFIGTAAFHGVAGELRYTKGASDTYISGDVNGDKTADFAIHLDDAVTLLPGYFLL
ncbi:hypothetical protein OE766_28160 [Pararhizobium sp. YC-54]|uniref:M10 family metallopeptidase C-terminal domain-containing protein n=1 Tax=Pararhizobium sp. YC-54 TaxID=2986920 RepID=UPI0021F6B332|nr:hypothetical protein [Pararhizobium sp. YC-54]MCW0002081.1 hypothetical protein [Pararhizobium sp. YC-54]